MLCEKCRKNKVSFIISISSDSLTKAIRVCEECATCENDIPNMRLDAEVSDRECPNCHLVYSQSTLLGCPTCYTEFREELTPVLNRIHGSTIHRGKGRRDVGKKGQRAESREQRAKSIRLRPKKEEGRVEGGVSPNFRVSRFLPRPLSQVPGSEAKWMEGNGPDCDVVISTRMRLARNLSGHAFCNSAEISELQQIAATIEESLAEMGENAVSPIHNAYSISLEDLSAVDREFLVERHLISRELAEKAKGEDLASSKLYALSSTPYKVIVSENETVSIMLNEEDHIRLQVINSGLQLRQSWEVINAIDDELGQKISYAFSNDWGYLTACPSNVGTGLRASVMFHIPALAATKEGNKILLSISDMGYAVRGMYGEGSQAIGSFYQISNEAALGQSEEEIIDRIRSIVQQVVDLERQQRRLLMEKDRAKAEDNIFRSYGTLMNARLISSREALELLSWVSLGISAGILPDTVANYKDLMQDEDNGKGGKEGNIRNIRGKIAWLLVLTRPAHLQKYDGRKLDAVDRDINRAAVIRAILKGFGNPC